MKNTRVALLFLLSAIFVFPGLGECAEPSAYDASLPADVTTNADKAYAILSKSAAEMSIARKNDLVLIIEKLSSHKTRDAAFHQLRKEEGIIPVLVVSYMETTNTQLRRELLGMISLKCSAKDYKEMIPFLKKECYRHDNDLRSSAIDAVAAVIRRGKGKRNHEPWLSKEEIQDGIRFLAVLANAQGEPYPFWQREAGEQLYRMSHGDLLPTNMLAAFKAGPSM